MQLSPGVARTHAGSRDRNGALTAGSRRPANRFHLCTFPRRTRCAASGPGGGNGPEQDALKKLAQEAERRAHHLLDCLTPKQEYDPADVTLIFLSTMVFMWLAAGLYRVYVFSYYLSGQHTIGSFWGH